MLMQQKLLRTLNLMSVHDEHHHNCNQPERQFVQMELTPSLGSVFGDFDMAPLTVLIFVTVTCGFVSLLRAIGRVNGPCCLDRSCPY